MTILLARHGSHSEVGKILSGRSDIALSPAGEAQAARLARRLARVPLAAIHSSPRRRARETAAAVADAKAMDVAIVDALDEIDFGEWAGRAFAELDGDSTWRAWNEARGQVRAPGGETQGEATERARAHIEALDPDGGTVLCVGHCDVIRGVVSHYLGLAPDRLLSFDVDPASLSELQLWPGGGRVVSINERPQ